MHSPSEADDIGSARGGAERKKEKDATLKCASGKNARACVAKTAQLWYIFHMLTKMQKTRAIKSVRKHENDTGSAAVQVALLTKQIHELASHLKSHVKDKHSRRGLLQMVADRRSHLKYLEKSDKKEYQKVIKALGLKK